MGAPEGRASRRTAGVVLLGVLLVSGCSFSASSGSERAASSSPGTAAASSSSSPASAAPSSGGVASGSSGSSGSAGSSGAATPSSGGPSAIDRCHTDELSASLEPGDSGAGQRYATLVLTNTSGGPCTLHGYGGLGLTGPDGSALPTQQVRVPDPAPTTVTLAPGATAGAQLHWGAVPATGDAQSGPCQPAPAALNVIPPDETTALSVPWTAGPVCDRGRIEQRAYTG